MWEGFGRWINNASVVWDLELKRVDGGNEN